MALVTHSWGILVLSPSLGARETPPHTPANWRMSSIYTWLWECVTHGSSAPHSQYVHPRVQHLTKREGSCVQPSPRPQKPKVTQPGRKTQHAEAETWPMSMSRVMGGGAQATKISENSLQHGSMNPSSHALFLHQTRWWRPHRLTSNAPAPTESVLRKKQSFFCERMY